MIGIYQIKNKITNKIYIGSSLDIHERWINHKSELKHQRHHSIHLQRAWNKHGSDNFEFIVLENCDDENIYIREQHYLDILLFAQDYINGVNTKFLELGYNLKPIAEKGFWGKHTEQTIHKMIVNRRNFQPIIAYDLDKTLIYEFRSANECAKIINTSQSVVLNACNSHNFQLIKVPYLVAYLKDSDLIKNYVVKDKHKYSPILCYDVYGNFIRMFDNRFICCDYFKLSPGNLETRLDNPIKKKILSKGNTIQYIFIRKSEINKYQKKLIKLKIKWLHIFNSLSKLSGNKIEVYDLFDELICRCNHLSEVGAIVNATPSNLHNALVGKRAQAKQLIFRYCDDIV